ncbi:hypothetical protein [Paraburkholderia caribensis]|uniref:hypothetical protein n=1 Tax=Paraburkholderia caribensis TaxID=75105 RepID=UPI001D07E24F|nr:hypothetical protein [Paraburkholderia caribensis]
MSSSAPKANYSGQLLRLRSEEKFPVVAQRLENVVLAGETSARGWHVFEWTTTFDAGVDSRRVSQNGEAFTYWLLVREVEERFLLASTHADIVQQFIASNRLARLVEKPVIDVASLVKQTIFPADTDAEQPGAPYRLGALYAAVDGFGRSVRTVSLFGDDLGGATLVRGILEYLNPFRVTLRDIRNDLEVLSISTQGEMNFYYRGASSLDAVDKALSHIRRGNFIHWRLKQNG